MDMIQTESGIKPLASEDMVRKQAEVNMALAMNSPLYRKLHADPIEVLMGLLTPAERYEGFRFKDWSALQSAKDHGSFASIDWSGCKQEFADTPVYGDALPKVWGRARVAGLTCELIGGQDGEVVGVNRIWHDTRLVWDQPLTREDVFGPAQEPNAKPAIKLAVAPLGEYRGLGWCDE